MDWIFDVICADINLTYFCWGLFVVLIGLATAWWLIRSQKDNRWMLFFASFVIVVVGLPVLCVGGLFLGILCSE